MAVLVTGGCGFIGGFVAKRFAAAGKRVIAYDVNPSRAVLDLILTPAQREAVTVVRGDLLDLPHMLRQSRAHGVDGIVHLGCMITAPTRENPTLGQAVNVCGTNNVFELGLAIGVPRVVWASTIDVFGPKSVSSDDIVRNDAAYDPQGIYGGCKMLNELAARDYATYLGLDPIALRIPAAYGPGMSRSWGRFVANLIEDLVSKGRGRAPTLRKVMPWLYVEDVADAFLRAMTVASSRELGFTLPGAEHGVDKVVSMIRASFPDAVIDDMEWPDFGTVPSYDGAKAEQLLGWRPRYSLEQGLKRMIEFYRGVKSGMAPD